MTNTLKFKLLSFSKEKKEHSLEKKAIYGDKKAFENLIENNEEYLYKMAFLYTKNEHDALDIFQDTVYKAFLNIDKLKEPSYFKTWITKILINTFNTKYKKTVNYLNIRDYEHKIEEVNYQQIEDKIDLYDAIDRLDEKYKTPIILQYFQDMTIGEIAEILDINENTIKTYLRRGKASLYELLKEEK